MSLITMDKSSTSKAVLAKEIQRYNTDVVRCQISVTHDEVPGNKLI